jgi:hypothetical protein
MDATRPRRTRDQARQQWYASQRQRRFARFMGVVQPRSHDEALGNALLAAAQRASRVIPVPGGSAWIVAQSPIALASV